MELQSVRVYDLLESAVASGFPMLTQYPTEEEFRAAVDTIKKPEFTKDATWYALGINTDCIDMENTHIKRLIRLASAPDGSGHKNALKGITVAMNVVAPVKWWVQAQRYSYFTIVSSMSTMHKIRDLVETGHIQFSPETSMGVVNKFFEYVYENPEATNAELAQAVPMGLELAARVTTNYLQLRTIWVQRHDHPLEDWKIFCKWIETLPLADKLITIK